MSEFEWLEATVKEGGFERKPVKFTQEEREQWIKFCLEVAAELGIACDAEKLRAMSDEQLDKEADWYWELTWK